jgi:hypothetical protein
LRPRAAQPQISRRRPAPPRASLPLPPFCFIFGSLWSPNRQKLQLSWVVGRGRWRFVAVRRDGNGSLRPGWRGSTRPSTHPSFGFTPLSPLSKSFFRPHYVTVLAVEAELVNLAALCRHLPLELHGISPFSLRVLFTPSHGCSVLSTCDRI